MKTIRRTWEVEGVLTSVTTAKLSDPTGTFGVKRTDNDAKVVDDGTAMTEVETGVYEYEMTEPVGYTGPYQAYVEFVYDALTYHLEHDIPATADVAIGGMTVSYTELKQRVGRRLYGIRTGFGEAQLNDINDWIREGLHSVYDAHRWSFLRPLTTITTTAPFTTGTVTIVDGVVTFTDTIPTWAASGVLTVNNATYRVATYTDGTHVTLEDTSLDADALSTFSLDRPEYDLPTAFDAFDTPILTYEPEQSLCYPAIKIVHETEIRERRQLNEYTDRPVIAAVRTVEFDSTVGSRRRLVFYPTPDDAYVLTGRMRLRPVMTGDTNTYPIGSEALAQVITDGCIAAGLRGVGDPEAVEAAKHFEKVLAQAIRIEQDAASPSHLGPDKGGEETISQWPRTSLMGEVTFDGEVM